MKRILKLLINGTERELAVEPNATLLDVLRDGLGLTGSKEGCGIGECGSCTVLMDGEPVNSCLVLAATAQGHSIETIESLAAGNDLHAIQRAFVEKGAIQCGFCTPGMILSAKALLSKKTDLSEHDIRLTLSGNLCRCTGYQKIVEAVMSAAKEMRIKDNE